MKWYEFTPADTLFFRGAEPLAAGMDYEVSLAFPPSASVLSGAIRSAVLAQKGISIEDYKSGHEISALIGDYGQDSPFKILGPLLRYEGDDLVPAPYTWFFEKDTKGSDIPIIKPLKIDVQTRQKLGLKTAGKLAYWPASRNDVKSIGGSWILLQFLSGKKTIFGAGTSIFMTSNGMDKLYSVESRTGIAMDSNRNVIESQLYNSRHIRLNRQVSLIWAIDQDCGLSKQGVLSLGGEQRFGAYHELDCPPDFPESGEQFLCLSPVPVNDESSEALIGTGEIIYRGGWDMAKQSHKDMIGYYPAGSVFNKNIKHCCVAF
ncbi:MAG: type III-B CRISPR module-associated Cmr3 family protein [Desulfobacterales bacterium]